MKPLQRTVLFFYISLAVVIVPTAVMAQEIDQTSAQPPSPESAAPIFQERCASCHGPTGQGDGPMAVEAQLFFALTDPAVLNETTPARWFNIISNGIAAKAMPPFGDASSNPLNVVDRWNLVFYLYTLGTPQTQIEMGAALYETFCIECHGTDGAGGDDAPALNDPATLSTQSQTDLFTTIDGHDLDLGDVEIWALTDYVRTFSYLYVAPSDVSLPAVADAAAVTSPFSGGAGVINGQVINGTAGAPSPQGLVIRLRAFDMDASFVDAITTTVAADGTFRFEDIDPTIPVQYEPQTTYQGLSYFGDLESAIVLSPEQPESNISITVHETTEDASNVSIEQLHIIIDFALNQVQVTEIYVLSNSGDRAYVGTLEEGTLRLTEPTNALDFQGAGDPGRYLTLADGLADTVPIPPGQNTAQSVVVYVLAYDGELELTRRVPYDTSLVNALVPSDIGIQVSGDGIRPGGPFATQDTAFDTYLSDSLSAGESLKLRLSGKPTGDRETTVPSPHQTIRPDETQSIVIGAIILGGTMVLVFLYWQGRLNLRPRLAAHPRQSALLQMIADLDDDFEAGNVKGKPYQEKRARLKEELIDLMEQEG
jgi:mono/diheme cytochrome c family protein